MLRALDESLVATFDVAFWVSNSTVISGDCKSMCTGSALKAGLERLTMTWEAFFIDFLSKFLNKP
jgi:hypothetical protein